MASCDDRDVSWAPGPTPERFGVEVSEAGLFLTLGKHKEELEIAGTWTPRDLSTNQFPWDDQPPKLESVEPISTLGDSDGLELLRTWKLETRFVLLIRVLSEFGNHDAVVAIRHEPASRTMAWLINAAGMDDHLAGHFDLSSWRFREALRLDPTFEIARWNLACALSRIGHIAAAIRELELLAWTPELAEKALTDTDLDPLREDEGFKKWMATLKAG